MIYTGDAATILKTLPENCVDCCVTSPPYYNLRDYGITEQIGLESTPEEYINKLVNVFREVRRVLKDDGTLWVNISDTYNGSNRGKGDTNTTSKSAKYMIQTGMHLPTTHIDSCKPKDLIGIPWMLAFALRTDGWYLRQDIIWHNSSAMPESVKDRCTKVHEYIFLLSKSRRYYFDYAGIAEPANYDGRKDTTLKVSKKYGIGGYGTSTQSINAKLSQRWNYDADGNPIRNKRSVWTVPTQGFSGAHFATYPPKLIEPCIIAGSRRGGIVLDPFLGSGTTAVVAQNLGRKYIGIELNPEYVEIAKERISANSEGRAFVDNVAENNKAQNSKLYNIFKNKHN